MRHLLLRRRAELDHRTFADLIRDNRTQEVITMLTRTPTLDGELTVLSAELDGFGEAPPAVESTIGDGGGVSQLPTPAPSGLDDLIAAAQRYLGDATVHVENVVDDTASADQEPSYLVDLRSELPFEEADSRYDEFVRNHRDCLRAIGGQVSLTFSGV